MSGDLDHKEPPKLNKSDERLLLPQIDKKDRKWLKSQAVITAATIVTAIATATYAGVTYFQWKALTGQVTAMGKQVEKMDEQVGLASQQLCLMRQSLKETKASNENAKSANRLAGESLLETQKSVKIAQKALELSEQATVSVQDVTIDNSTLAVGKEPIVTFVLINKGKTNALKPVKHAYLGIGTEKDHGGSSSTLLADPPIAPDIPFLVILSKIGGLSQQEFDSINNGVQRLYAYINVTYYDVFKQEHQFEECRYYELKLKRFVICHLHSGIIK